jgi:hypothetical protein
MKKFLFLLGALALAACTPPAGEAIKIEHAVFAPPIGVSGVGAGYFTLQNNGPADELLSASSPAASAIEFHETVMEGGMMSMRRLEKVDLPAGGIVAFAPGGRHLMLFGVKPDLAAGSSVIVTLTFAKAGARPFTFPVGAAETAMH